MYPTIYAPFFPVQQVTEHIILDRDIIDRRTELFPNSFIPSSVSLWNNLPHELNTLQSLSLFKSKIIQSFNISKVPEYHVVGNRQLSLLHTRIRNYCSDRQLDLFNNHVSDNAFCSCGHCIESAEHYFFRCSHYTLHRHKLFNQIHETFRQNTHTHTHTIFLILVSFLVHSTITFNLSKPNRTTKYDVISNISLVFV